MNVTGVGVQATAGDREAAGTVPPVAIVGISLRIPGASDVDGFWHNLVQGVESVRFFSREELLAAGEPATRIDSAWYVPARAIVPDADEFDAGFFGLTDGEAELTDPQQRLMIEATWRVLEDAGYPPGRQPRIGLYVAGRENGFASLVANDPYRQRPRADQLRILMGSATDYLATRVAYLLDLRGPCLAVQTGCSGSLVAVHLAARALAAGDCDVAVAGGVGVSVPLGRGYLWEEGMVESKDGHNRTFDAEATGIVGGDGVGLVALRLLDDAIRDGDQIYAVIRGTATNNDGRDKLGFTAPSVSGQVDLMRSGLAQAGISPDSVGYVECHGTATRIGDPIELRALNAVFGANRDHPCWIGSVKSNIGHLDAAAGVCGLIKAALAVRYGELPPSLHLRIPNPLFDWQSSPLQVCQDRAPFPRLGAARRAVVSSLGMGGTNAFAVIEQAPPVPHFPQQRWHVLPVSARSASGLQRACHDLSGALSGAAGDQLANVAFTLDQGRHRYPHRAAVVCRTRQEAAQALARPSGQDFGADLAASRMVLLLPGQGSQVVGAGQGLYRHEPAFTDVLDEVATLVREQAGWDPRAVLCADHIADDHADVGGGLSTDRQQVSLFAFQYAMAAAAVAHGLVPDLVLGHSVGEVTAAAITGVLSLADAVTFSLARGQVCQLHAPDGGMVAVALSEHEALGHASATGCHLAAVNAVRQCVLSGTSDQLAELTGRLDAARVAYRVLAASRPFHSPLLAPAAAALASVTATLDWQRPTIGFVSSATGAVVEDRVATATYWQGQLVQPVRFAAALVAAAGPATAYVDLGPGQSLRRLAASVARGSERPGVAVGLHPSAPGADQQQCLLAATAKLWLAGAPVHWRTRHAGARRISLPGHAMDRRRYPVPHAPAAVVTIPPQAAPPLVESTAPSAGEPTAPAAADFTAEGPRPGSSTDDSSAEFLEVVLAIFEEVIGAPMVDPDRTFLEAGGDSLMAAQAVTRLNAAFGVELTMTEFLERTSAGDVAAHLARVA